MRPLYRTGRKSMSKRYRSLILILSIAVMVFLSGYAVQPVYADETDNNPTVEENGGRRPDHQQVGIPVPLRTAAVALIPVPAVETRHLQIQVAAAPVPEESHPAAVIRIPAERVLPAATPIQAVRTHLVMTIHPVMRTHPVTSLRPVAKTHPAKGPLRAERPATIPVSPARTTSPDPVLRQSPAPF